MNINVTPISHAQYDFMRFSRPEALCEVLYYGGLGCGKSEALCVAVSRWMSVPNSVVILCSTTLLALKRSTIPLLRKYIPDSIIASGTFREGDVVIKNNSRLICSGTQDADRLKSINAHAVFFDELTHSKEENYETIMLRARVAHPYGNVAMSVCNPASKRIWVYGRLVSGADNRTVFALQGKSTDNKYLGAGYIAKLNSLSPAKRALLRDGEWGTPDNVVFYGLSESNVVSAPPFIPYRFVLMQDYGGGTGVAGLLGAWIDETGTKMWFCDEFGGERVTHRYMMQRMEQMVTSNASSQAERQVVYDAANAALGMDMRNAGWVTTTCDKAIEEGVAVVNDALVGMDVYISPKCKLLLDALETRTRDELGNIRKRKGWDLLDAMRYGVVHQHGISGVKVSR